MQKTAVEMGNAAGPSLEPIRALNLFQFHDQLWTRCGQQLQEFWASAENHLKASALCRHAAKDLAALL